MGYLLELKSCYYPLLSRLSNGKSKQASSAVSCFLWINFINFINFYHFSWGQREKNLLFSILSFKETVVFKLGFFYIETWLFNGAVDQSGGCAICCISHTHLHESTDGQPHLKVKMKTLDWGCFYIKPFASSAEVLLQSPSGLLRTCHVNLG